jgi:hypothetical protein
LKGLFRILALGFAVAATALPAVAQVYVTVAPPAPIVETRPAMPHAGWVWVGGYYRWNGYRYVWVGGHWVRPPHGGAVWIPGHWVQNAHGRWFWRAGHWRY